MKYGLTAALVVALVGCTTLRPTKPQTFNPAVADLQSKTVAIIVADEDGVSARCSGVWVDANRFVTAHHCIGDDDLIAYVGRDDVLKRQGQTRLALRFGYVSADDPEHDVALVTVNEVSSHGTAVLAKNVYAGLVVRTMGHPFGLLWSFSAGHIAAVRTGDDGESWVQSTAPISPGNSGGGLFNEAGELVGVCVSTGRPPAQNLNRFADVRYVRALMEAKQ
jgi:serine protease Do